MELKLDPRQYLTWFLSIIFALAVMHVTSQTVYRMGYDYPDDILRILDSGGEFSLGNWFSVVIMLVASVVLAVIAFVQKNSGSPFANHWAMLAVIFLGLSIDEGVAFHESTIEPLRKLLDVHGFLAYTWVLPGFAFAFLVFVTYLPFLRHLPVEVAQMFMFTGAVYVAGAAGTELFEGFMGQHYGPASDQATIFKAVQEPMEMLGVVLFIHANLLYLRDYVGVKSLGFTVTADVEPARRMEPLAASPGQT